MVETILATFPHSFRPRQIVALGNSGGFSGARLWRVDTAQEGVVCVRRWPSVHPTEQHLRWIHRVLTEVRQQGCDFVPSPFPNDRGDMVVSSGGSLWDVTPWMPGEASLRQSFSDSKLSAACRALARFHCACADMGGEDSARSPAIQHRYDVAIRFRNQIKKLRNGVENMTDVELRRLCAEVLRHASAKLSTLPELLEPATRELLPLQPCIRDIWYPHVLFQGEELSGIVDFGAMRVDTVALDLARLLSSVELCNPHVWQRGVEFYSSIRPLPANELRVMHVGAQATLVLSGLNWVNWLAVEKRSFENQDLVERRLAELLEHLSG